MDKKNKGLEELKLKADDIFSVLNCIKIISDADKFKDWLKKEHGISNFDDLFDGYKFFLESAIRTFLQTIMYDSSLSIKEDFVFYRATFVGVELNKIPDTCEKTILLKNINKKLRIVKKAKNWQEIKEALNQFNKDVLVVFEKIFSNNVEVIPKLNISKDNALKYTTMFYTYIFLNDTSRFLPHGYWVSVLDNRIDLEQYKKNFEGYKYSLQFVWFSLLGEKYYSTSIKKLHQSKDWSVKKEFLDLNNKPKGLKERDDLDAYFRKIQTEIIMPLEEKLKVDFVFTKILYLKKKISKGILKDLLKPSKEPQLNEKEKLDFELLWYPVEVLDSSKSHIFSGVPAFISLLAGTVERKRVFSSGEKAYICKFIHPNESVKGNDFSYGVLIEAVGSTGISDYSGWILFFDCCGDYSGFSGSEHAMAEMFIRTYREKGSIELREMVIDKTKFRDYIADKIVSDKREEITHLLEETTKRRKERDIVNEARGLVLELITYYTLSKKKHYLVDWNITVDKEQLDIILETNSDFTLIECILDPNNENIDEEIEKIKRKMDNYNTNKNKNCQFWFWSRPSQKTSYKLKIARKKWPVLSEPIVLSELIRKNPDWQNKKLDKLKTILGFAGY